MLDKANSAWPSGYSLVEILTVISIIGILTAISVAVMVNVRDQAMDLRRITDVRTLQDALERYANDHNGVYPTDDEVKAGQPLVSNDPGGPKIEYLKRVPVNPSPRAKGDCVGRDRDYVYKRGYLGRSYTISYCLVDGAASLDGGPYYAMPTVIGVPENDKCTLGSDISDIKKPCCGFANVGAYCGGGQLFAKNHIVGQSQYDLVVVDNGQDGYDTYADAAGVDELADSASDGLGNISALAKQSPANPAAEYCDSLSLYDFDDWYLPAREELAKWCKVSISLNNSYRIQTYSYYWSSSQDQADKAGRSAYLSGSSCAVSSAAKDGSQSLKCIRRF